MKIFTLRRIAQNDKATYGVLIYQGTPFCLTLERPWKDNQENESCIPVGRYAFRLRYSPTFKYVTPILQGVPNREYILIHKGNSPVDTKGCILVGEQYDKGLILHSGKAFDEMMSLVGQDEVCQLEVE